MLKELSGLLDNQKSNDLLKRLEHRDTNSALAAEAELSVLWAISRVAHLVPEPKLPHSGHRPDAYSDDLFSSSPAVIEICALSDDSFSGKEAMDRTANIISGFADQIKKGAGNHLYFEFGERSYYTKNSNPKNIFSQFHRERCVDPNFNLEDEIKNILRQWIRKLSIDIVIVLSPYRQREFGFSVYSEMIWNVSCFDRRNVIPEGDYKKIKEMAAELPRPNFESYQARDIHKQGGFSGNGKNWYLPTTISTGGGKMTIKLSAGLLHEYLAGRIDAKKFREKAFRDDKNFFDMGLTRGNFIRKVEYEPGGVDEDDDYIVFDLDIDWDKIAEKNLGNSKADYMNPDRLAQAQFITF